MRYINWIFAVLIILPVLLAGCREDNYEDTAPQEPTIILDTVNYYLSEQDKSLLECFQENDTIKYLNQEGNQLKFRSDTFYNYMSTYVYEQEYIRKELMNIQYTCLTTYFPNYSFVITLMPWDSSNVRMDVLFGTGTYWEDWGNDYNISGFKIDPYYKMSIDTVYPNYHTLRYNYYDSIALESNMFYGVYHMWDDTFIEYHTASTTIDCYYSNELGLVAFKNFDGNFWLLETEE